MPPASVSVGMYPCNRWPPAANNMSDSHAMYLHPCRYDRCICMYDIDKLDKPKEAFKRVRDCARAGITSLTLDAKNNVLLCGSLDGAMRVWSLEGR